LLLPIFAPGLESGFIRDVKMLGITGSAVAASLFIVLVFLYCRDLQKALELIHSDNRAASPTSVWLMFLIPYNFIEDFFIIYHVSKSIKQESRKHPSLGSHSGKISGLGWCIAQIFAIFPGVLGLIGGVIALILWLAHWHFVKTTIKRLIKIHKKNDSR